MTMEEKKVKEDKITCKVFCDRAICNKHYRFHLEKKYGNVLNTEKEWESICKKDKIEIKKA